MGKIINHLNLHTIYRKIPSRSPEAKASRLMKNYRFDEAATAWYMLHEQSRDLKSLLKLSECALETTIPYNYPDVIMFIDRFDPQGNDPQLQIYKAGMLRRYGNSTWEDIDHVGLLEQAGETLDRIAPAATAFQPSLLASFLLEKGLLLAVTGNPDKGRLFMERSAKIDPSNWRARAHFGETLNRQLGLPEEALETITPLLNNGNMGDLVLSVAAESSANLRFYDQAAIYAKRAAKLFGFDPTKYLMLATYHIKAGNYFRGLHNFKKYEKALCEQRPFGQYFIAALGNYGRLIAEKLNLQID